MKIQIIHRACGGTEFLPQPAPPAPGRTERGRRGPAAVPAARKLGQLRHCPVPAPQRRHPAGPGAAGRRCLRDGGPPPHRLHRWAVDAGRRERLRLHRLHPPRPVRHLCHPAHRRRLRGPAAHPVRAVRGPRAGKCQHSRHGGPERLGQRRTLHFQCRTGTDCLPGRPAPAAPRRPGVHPGPRLLPPAPKSWPRQTVRY